eukprot:15135971-Alexandrium_andersonii.AAC.1
MTLCPGFVAYVLRHSYMGRNPVWVVHGLGWSCGPRWFPLAVMNLRAVANSRVAAAAPPVTVSFVANGWDESPCVGPRAEVVRQIQCPCLGKIRGSVSVLSSAWVWPLGFL